ncbi:MarC family protein [Schaalia sp. 19OD2882]|uniref:MarC family protein n=1 Tax=Schaalia sp. 19OD2882 TaxID=2794089 RepID=UPI001C1EA0EE|nr:MarC family protein [Schaalia sp. 19OD2882]QWW20610.1 MarC family protein [Schaalia sp. 19OD2882]
MNFDAVLDVALLAPTFTTLLVIMDPPGTIPVFLGLTSRYTPAGQKRAARQATAVSFGVIVVFAVLGQQILHLLQISVEALQFSGGVLLFLVAMELLMGGDAKEPDTGDERVNVALVPLGTPLLAGPGAIVAVMVAVGQANHGFGSWVAVLVAVVAAHAVMWATMRFSLKLSRLLGPGGIMLLTKIAGLLLASIATQMAMSAFFRFVHEAGIGS